MPANENNTQLYLTPNYEYAGYCWPVISEYRIRKDIMDGIFEILAKFFEKTSKLTAIRLELRLKQVTKDNRLVGVFFQQLKRRILSHYGYCYHGYIWVREKKDAQAQHYHAALLVDGQKVKHSNIIKKMAECCWPHGLLALPDHPFYRIDRSQIQLFQALVYRLSYLAKAETKGERAASVKDYQISRSIRNT